METWEISGDTSTTTFTSSGEADGFEAFSLGSDETTKLVVSPISPNKDDWLSISKVSASASVLVSVWSEGDPFEIVFCAHCCVPLLFLASNITCCENVRPSITPSSYGSRRQSVSNDNCDYIGYQTAKNSRSNISLFGHITLLHTQQ